MQRPGVLQTPYVAASPVLVNMQPAASLPNPGGTLSSLLNHSGGSTIAATQKVPSDFTGNTFISGNGYQSDGVAPHLSSAQVAPGQPFFAATGPMTLVTACPGIGMTAPGRLHSANPGYIGGQCLHGTAGLPHAATNPGLAGITTPTMTAGACHPLPVPTPSQGPFGDFSTSTGMRPAMPDKAIPAFRNTYIMGRPVSAKVSQLGTPGALPEGPGDLGNSACMGSLESFDAQIAAPRNTQSPESSAVFDHSTVATVPEATRQRVEDALDAFLSGIPAWRCGQRDVGQAPSESPERGRNSATSRSNSRHRWRKDRSRSRRRPSPVPAPPRKGSMFDVGPNKPLPPAAAPIKDKEKKEKKEKKDEDNKKKEEGKEKGDKDEKEKEEKKEDEKKE